ncbi:MULTISPECIES: hypothetical protein [unclassified Streptomyces]|nr:MULTISPECIES: hypothetical protein [unclassified Streptomyces]MCH0556240.1 hypothetical protein [Streptomyces sp. MUM 16J]
MAASAVAARGGGYDPDPDLHPCVRGGGTYLNPHIGRARAELVAAEGQ